MPLKYEAKKSNMHYLVQKLYMILQSVLWKIKNTDIKGIDQWEMRGVEINIIR